MTSVGIREGIKYGFLLFGYSPDYFSGIFLGAASSQSLVYCCRDFVRVLT